MQTKTFNGATYVQDPVTKEWVKVPSQQQAAQPQTPQVVVPAPPPPPPPPPPRTAPGAVTEGLPPGYTWVDPNNPNLGVRPIPGYTPKGDTADDIEPLKIGQFRALENQLATVESLFRQGPGSTSGIGAIADYLPSDINSQFDTAGAGLGDVAFAAFRVPGAGPQSDADLKQFINANLPRAGDRDSAIQQKIANIRNRMTTAMDAVGIAPNAPQDGPNAMTVLRMGGGAGVAAVPRGDAGSQTIRDPNDIPPGMAEEMDEVVARVLSQGNGRLDPQLYAQEAAKVADKYNFGVSDPVEWATRMNEYLDAGGTTIPSGVIPAERLMSATETMKNNLANNFVGGAFAGAANGISAGTVDAMLPGEMMAMRDAQPIPVLAGEIGGGIGATVAGGRLAGMAAARYAPRLMQGSQFGRNVAADAFYGGIYGQNTQGKPVSGAITAAAGSTAGQVAVRGGSAVVGGVSRTPEAIALREAGVPISVARQIGPNAARFEDALQSIPIVGDRVRDRLLESFTGVEQAALRESGEAIGYTPQAGGRDGLEELLGTPQQKGAIGGAYDNAVAGQRFTPDAPFNQTIDDAYAAAGALPPDLAARATLALDNRLGQLRGAPQITGEQFQQSRRGLKSYKAETTKPGFEEDYRKVIDKGIGALDDLVARQGSPEVLANLRKADTSFRSAKTLEKAMNTAAGGSQTGEIFLPTPNQLQRAGMKTQERFPGPRPFADLSDNAQTVLGSKLPNSGTIERAIAATGLLGVGGSIGGVLGYDDQSPVAGTAGGTGGGLLTAAVGGGLLALGGRRGSQEALEKLLFERPEAVRELAEIAARRGGGLLGSAGAIYGQQFGY